MKKLLSLLLTALLLCLPVMSIAEDAAYNLYENETFGYTVNVPADLIEMSEDNLQKLITLGGSMLDEGTLKTQMESFKAANMAYFFTSDMVGNMNISASDASIFTSTDMLLQYKEVLVPSFLAQYQQLDPNVVCTAEEELFAAGENTYFVLNVDLTANGVALSIIQFMTVSDSLLFTFTFTNTDSFTAEGVVEMLTSFARK